MAEVAPAPDDKPMETPTSGKDVAPEITPPPPEVRAKIDEKEKEAEHPLSPEVAIAAASITESAALPADNVRGLMPKLHEATQRFHQEKKKLDETLDSNEMDRTETIDRIHESLRKTEEDLEDISDEMHDALKPPSKDKDVV